MDHAVSEYGGLDLAFNNAGIEGEVGPLVEQTEANYDAVMDINVKGVWLSMKYEIPRMLERGGGAIVNCSSVAGLIGFPGFGIYVASKHAVIGLTKTAALEYSTQGIRINAVNPAVIDTEMVDRFTEAIGSRKEDLAPCIPSGALVGSKRWPRPFCGCVPAGRPLSRGTAWLSTADSPPAETRPTYILEGRLLKEFDGKAALVTGGGSGIGRATALAFAREGARVVIGDRNARSGEETVRTIRDTGGMASFRRADVSVASDVEALVEHTMSDIWPARSGLQQRRHRGRSAAACRTERSQLRRGHGHQCQRRLALHEVRNSAGCLEHGGGAIVNASSVAGLIGFPGIGIYAASKHAVIGLTKTAALEYSAQGIRINAVNPGLIDTEMADRLACRRKDIKRRPCPPPSDRADWPARGGGRDRSVALFRSGVFCHRP